MRCLAVTTVLLSLLFTTNGMPTKVVSRVFGVQGGNPNVRVYSTYPTPKPKPKVIDNELEKVVDKEAKDPKETSQIIEEPEVKENLPVATDEDTKTPTADETNEKSLDKETPLQEEESTPPLKDAIDPMPEEEETNPIILEETVNDDEPIIAAMGEETVMEVEAEMPAEEEMLIEDTSNPELEAEEPMIPLVDTETVVIEDEPIVPEVIMPVVEVEVLMPDGPADEVIIMEDSPVDDGALEATEEPVIDNMAEETAQEEMMPEDVSPDIVDPEEVIVVAPAFEVELEPIEPDLTENMADLMNSEMENVMMSEKTDVGSEITEDQDSPDNNNIAKDLSAQTTADVDGTTVEEKQMPETDAIVEDTPAVVEEIPMVKEEKDVTKGEDVHQQHGDHHHHVVDDAAVAAEPEETMQKDGEDSSNNLSESEVIEQEEVTVTEMPMDENEDMAKDATDNTDTNTDMGSNPVEKTLDAITAGFDSAASPDIAAEEVNALETDKDDPAVDTGSHDTSFSDSDTNKPTEEKADLLQEAEPTQTVEPAGEVMLESNIEMDFVPEVELEEIAQPLTNLAAVPPSVEEEKPLEEQAAADLPVEPAVEVHLTSDQDTNVEPSPEQNVQPEDVDLEMSVDTVAPEITKDSSQPVEDPLLQEDSNHGDSLTPHSHDVSEDAVDPVNEAENEGIQNIPEEDISLNETL